MEPTGGSRVDSIAVRKLAKFVFNSEAETKSPATKVLIVPEIVTANRVIPK